VTFVTFARGRVTFVLGRVTFGRDGDVPGAGEVLMPRPLAKAIGALPAHPRRRSGAFDAPGRVQGDDELDLPGDGPAVTANAAGGGGVVHPQAWSTNGVL
jgi:hypothetical protein